MERIASERVTGIVVAHFGRKKKSCIKGFGICKLFPKRKLDDVSDEVLAAAVAEPHDDFYARFSLVGTDMGIRFLEPVPHFEEEFHVDEAEPPFEPRYEGLLGFEYVEPVPGVYRADRKAGKFGGVTVKVRTGRRQKR